jgi:hypothetical protein
MDDRILEDGDAVYQLGDPPNSIFAVIEGCILITAAGADGKPVGQVLGPGSIYDFSLALGAGAKPPRIKALGTTKIRMYSRAEAQISATDGAGEFSGLLARILGTGGTEAAPAAPAEGESPVEIVDDEIEEGEDYSDEPVLVRLIIDDPEIADSVEYAEYDLYAFPFIVGRVDGEGLHGNIDLSIPDSSPFQLSRRHFMLERKDDIFQVVDCNSYHGTIVNGDKLGGGSTSFRKTLPPGENEIVAVTEDSSFRFICVVGTEDNPIVDP